MTITEQQILVHLLEESFGTVVTRDGESVAARTMLFAFDGKRDFFFLTHHTREKLAQIRACARGLLHLGAMTDDVVSSWNIRARGAFDVVQPTAEQFVEAVELLGRKSEMIRDLMHSDGREDWVVVRLRADEILGWTYQQAVEQLPKTRVGSTS